MAAPSRGAWLLALLAALWILPGLLGHDPWKPDEAYTFGLVHHILTTGDWVVPTLADEPFVEKPPLYYLTAALSAKLFSPWLPLHDGARLASGAWMAVALAFAGLAGRSLSGPGRGWIAPVILIGCLGLSVRAHQMITDTALFAGMAVSLCGLAIAATRPVLAGAVLGTGVGIGFLSKGLLLPGVLGITCLALPVLFRAWRTRAYLTTLVVAAAFVLPWIVVWPWALHPLPALFAEWLWENNFGRFSGANDLGPPADRMHYLRILPWYAWPAWLLAAWVLWTQRRRITIDAGLQVPLVAFAVTLLVLSASADARELYAMPMLVPLALLATGRRDAAQGAANLMYWFAVMGFTVLAAVVWFYWGALELGVPARLNAHLNAMQPGYAAGVRPLAVALAATYCIAWIALIARLPRIPERPVIVWAAGMTLIWGMVMILFVRYLDTGKSYRPMVVSMTQSLPDRYRCISSRILGEPQRAMLQYFAGIVTYRDDVPGRRKDCDLLLTQGDSKSEAQPGPEWVRIWEGNRLGDDVERYRLYQRRTAREPDAR